MLHEEFAKLTGVNVSFRHYREKVEPGYNNSKMHKDDWCAEWLKENKKFIVKTHLLDIEALSRDISLMDSIRTENQRIREEKDATLRRNQDLEFKVESIENDNQNLRIQVDAFAETIGGLEKEVEQLAAESIQLKTAIKVIDEKDNEILRLKAMLFDQMIKQN
jgi:predicted RNase H-like nuclease (RuvC/YqgF family)